MPSFLSTADWKKALKDQPDAGEAAPLTKALEAYERVEGKDDYESLQTALEQVVTRARAAKAKNAKNKKLNEFLDGVVTTAAKEKAKLAGAAKAKADEDGEGEVNYQIAPFFKIAKAASQDKGLPFLYAPGTKMGGLVIHRSIAGKHKKIARDLRDANNGKAISGSTLIEGVCYGKAGHADPDQPEAEDDDSGGGLIFLVEKDPKSGLAKCLMRTLMKQLGKKVRVKVKGPTVETDDESDLDEMADEGQGDPTTSSVPPPPPPPPPTDDARRFVQRAKAIRDLLDRFAASNAEKAAPLRTAYAEALRAGQAKDYAAAFTQLQAVEDQLRTALRPTTTTTPTSKDTVADGSAVSFAKIKIQWNQAKQLVESQLDQLTANILADVDEKVVEEFDEDGNEVEIELDDTGGAEKKLSKVLSRLNMGLGEALDAHYTAEPSARPALLKRIDAIANDYLAYVEDDPLIALVEENPYRKVAIRSVLRLPLTKLIEQVAAASTREAQPVR